MYKSASSINPNKALPTFTITELMKTIDKENTMKAAREKCCISYREALIRITADFSSENMGLKSGRIFFEH